MLQYIKITAIAVAALWLAAATASAQQPSITPELEARMDKEKEARRACKVEICNAFAKPATGTPITCDVTKTWTQQEITTRIVGGSYVWRYGHTQCNVKLALDRELIAKAMKEAKTTIAFPEHAFVCNVDDADPAKGKAFSVTVSATPAIVFENGQAKAVKLEPVKAEGSTVASAAVASLMAVEKVSGLLSRSVVSEINTFLYKSCKEIGATIVRK